MGLQCLVSAVLWVSSIVGLQCCDDLGLAVLQLYLRIQDNISRENRIGAMNPGIEFHVVPCAVSGQIKE